MIRVQRLSESEMEIMQVLWRSGAPMTTSNLMNLFSHKGWKPQTLSTFLKRLVDKGVLAMEKRGRSNLYNPVLTERAYHAREAQAVMDAFYQGDPRRFLAAYYGEGISRTETEILKRWLDRLTLAK